MNLLRSQAFGCLGVLAVTTVLGGCLGTQSAPLLEVPVSPLQHVPVRERAPLKSEAAYAYEREERINEVLRFDERTGEPRFEGETHYVIVTSFRFDPDTLFLKSGTVVRLRLGNPSLITHYFGGDEFFRYGAEIVDLMGTEIPLNLHHVEVPPHQVVDLYLFIKDPGEYRMDCFVPAHRLEGMVGAIIVESA